MYLAIGADTATGTSCRVALEVIKSAGGQANFGADCYVDLCVDQSQITHGFRCTVASGDAVWKAWGVWRDGAAVSRRSSRGRLAHA
jgi:hypothetical protein